MKKKASKNAKGRKGGNVKNRRRQEIKKSPNRLWLWLGGTVAVAAVIAVTLILTVFSDSADDPVVARVNRIGIHAADVAFEMSRAEEAVFLRDGQITERAVREEAVRLAALTVIFEDFASRHGLTLTAEQQSWIDEEVAAMLAEFGGEQGANEYLQEMGINGIPHMERLYASWWMMDNVFEYIMSNPEVFAEFERFMELDDAYDRANDILARAQAGESFDMLIAQYGEDPGMTRYTDGYTFIRGDMVSEFEEETIALEIGEISGIVPTVHGYHIIMRVEPDPDNVMEGSMYVPGSDEELLGAKHILIRSRSIDERMMEAIDLGFDEKIDNAEFEFLQALDDVAISS